MEEKRVMICGRCGAKLTIPEWARYIKNKNNPDKGDSCGACGRDNLVTLIEDKTEQQKTKTSVNYHLNS